MIVSTCTKLEKNAKITSVIITKDSPLAALSMDLKRISVFIKNDSLRSAVRFNQEAEKRLNESRNQYKEHSIQKLFNEVDKVLKQDNSLKKAEDALMYSTLVQNYAQKNF